MGDSFHGKTVNGQGADTDTLVASARAYVNALNKLLVKRAKTAPKALLAADGLHRRHHHLSLRLVALLLEQRREDLGRGAVGAALGAVDRLQLAVQGLDGVVHDAVEQGGQLKFLIQRVADLEQRLEILTRPAERTHLALHLNKRFGDSGYQV